MPNADLDLAVIGYGAMARRLAASLALRSDGPQVGGSFCARERPATYRRNSHVSAAWRT